MSVLRVRLVEMGGYGQQGAVGSWQVDPGLMIRNQVIAVPPGLTPIPGDLEGTEVSRLFVRVGCQRVRNHQFAGREFCDSGKGVDEGPGSIRSTLPGPLGGHLDGPAQVHLQSFQLHLCGFFCCEYV